MTMTLVRQAARSARSDLRVDRTGIRFWNSSPDTVTIEFTVRNTGTGRSSPTEAVIQAAPLGAFVAWRDLGRLAVPAVEPGQEIVLRAQAACDPLPAPTSPPTGARPQRVERARLRTARDLFDRRRPEAVSDPVSLGTLPADPLRALMCGSAHWAGNLNIFVGRRPTERHMAKALAVRPGRVNVAMFMVGTGSDAYRFHLEGEVASWDTRLLGGYILSRVQPDKEDDRAIPLDEWFQVPGQTPVMLSFEPPEDCREGRLDAHVEQQSTGKKAIVEFGFDPSAVGPGCYTV
ncbi:MAG: hypothetical protein ACYTGF_07020 [Planctomycetota bacterium]|jgi:hypothetical protein